MIKKLFAVCMTMTMLIVSAGVNEDNKYQITYPEWVHACGQMRGFMSPERPINEDDVQTLASWNANLLRFQFVHNWGVPNTDQNLDEYEKWIDMKIKELDTVLTLCEKYGIKVVVDLHSPPGGRHENGEMNMFYEKKYADKYFDVWKKIARFCFGRRAVWAYDLINEPEYSNNPDRITYIGYLELQKQAALVVRDIDPYTPIIIESNHWDCADSFKDMEALEIPNVIYQFHSYAPGTYTHQGVGRSDAPVFYPGEIDGEYWDRERLKKEYAHVRSFQLRHNARIYVGEFSAVIWAPHPENYLRDCISIFEEYGWDYTYHAFRESKIWSIEHEVVKPHEWVPSENNSRKEVILEALKKNIMFK